MTAAHMRLQLFKTPVSIAGKAFYLLNKVVFIKLFGMIPQNLYRAINVLKHSK